MDAAKINELGKIIAELGILIIIAAIFIIQTVQTNKKLNQREDHNEEALSNLRKTREEASVEYQKIVQEAIRRHFLRDDHNQELVEGEGFTYALNEKKHSVLKRGLNDSNASQVLYFSYHNGGTDFMGIPFQRMSCTHIVSSENTPHYPNRFKDMFRVSFYNIYKDLMQVSSVAIPNIEEYKTVDPATYESFKHCAKAMLIHNIKNIRGAEVGFIMFMFPEVLQDEDKVKLLMNVVQSTAYRMEGILQSAEIEYKENIRSRVYGNNTPEQDSEPQKNKQ